MVRGWNGRASEGSRIGPRLGELIRLCNEDSSEGTIPKALARKQKQIAKGACDVAVLIGRTLGATV